MANSGHRSEASLRNHIDRPSSEQLRACSGVLSDVLIGKPHQSLHPSFTALSSQAISMFRWIWPSFIHKTLALNSLFSHCNMKSLRVFMSHNSARWEEKGSKTAGKFFIEGDPTKSRVLSSSEKARDFHTRIYPEAKASELELSYGKTGRLQVKTFCQGKKTYP